MGSFFTDILSFQHETAVFDVNPHQLRFVYNTYRFTTLEEIKDFEPELVINAVTVKYTLDAFHKVLPVLPKDCIISDIASVKTGLKKSTKKADSVMSPLTRCSDLHSLIWDNWRKRIRLLSPRAIIWARSSSRIFIPASACISANTRSRSTIKW